MSKITFVLFAWFVPVSWFTGFLYFVLYFTPLILALITKLIVGLRRRLFSCTSPTIQLYQPYLLAVLEYNYVF